ncbi:MAG: deoxyguanosinetriphosphate triphosphohydrolase [Deltaproteobacteria bacterium]|nr:deoxyguanosinetriphosphate triphosphohydrolase [Deltaproteobacteria bacterium]
MLKTRVHLEEIEFQILAPYACHSQKSMGREYAEPEHPYRSRFQRDRDRIIHSKAFRRLEYKTQVFVNHEGDHYRTRLTHSLEVAQISRSMARMLGLNEDLAEAIALAHDLGHPPFGHSGQEVMDELMKDFGGFEHNRQSLRVVTLLELAYPNFPGLNLTYEVLEGISKHFTEYDLPQGRVFAREGEPSLEAQMVNLADEIAYNNHDLDDGLRSGLISLAQLRAVELWQENFEGIQKLYPQAPEEIQCRVTVKGLINLLVTDLIEETQKNILERNIQTLEEVRSRGKMLVGFSEGIKKKTVELKRFLFANLYRHYRVERMAHKAGRIIRDLFKAYLDHPKILPTEVFQKIQEGSQVERIVCDYVAGMTDRFALEEYEKLFNPHTKV